MEARDTVRDIFRGGKDGQKGPGEGGAATDGPGAAKGGGEGGGPPAGPRAGGERGGAGGGAPPPAAHAHLERGGRGDRGGGLCTPGLERWAGAAGRDGDGPEDRGTAR